LVLACNFPRDERLGSSRVPLRLSPELTRMGAEVTTLFAEDLPAAPRGRAAQLSAPFRMAKVLATRAKTADVVDIAGFDAWTYARFARQFRRGQAIVSRSNGLWDRALATDGVPRARGWARRIASQLYQAQVLCRWERASMIQADMAVYGSYVDRDEGIARGWRTLENAAAVNLGVDEFFASDVPLEARQGVAFVGTFFHRKGSDIAAAAMSRVLRERPALSLSLLGPGIAAADALVQFDADVRARVVVVDAMPSDQLARRLGSFAVLLFPTRYEGFGLVVTEAMRAGLAVVTTPTGAGADIVRDGENGLMVPFDDVDATAAAVKRLVDDPALRTRLAAAAVAEATGRTWRRAAEELLAVYERARALARRR